MKKRRKMTRMVALILALFVFPQICVGDPYDITQGTPYVFDPVQGHDTFLSKIDDTHYLCAYRGLDVSVYEGVAVVFTVNTSDWTLSTGTDYRFGTYAVGPCLSQIDATHYLCAYEAAGSAGNARVLIVNTIDWTVSSGTASVFDPDGERVYLSKIDDTHYLCAYTGTGSNGYAVVLTVNTGDWTVSNETAHVFDAALGYSPKLSQIDATHYLCTYYGSDSNAFAVVLTVNTGDWTVSSGTAYTITGYGIKPDLAKMDDTHYLCSYSGSGSDGYAVVLIVDTGDWTVTSGTAYEFDIGDGNETDLAQIDDTHYLCAYRGSSSDGYAVVLTVNTNDWTVSNETPYEYDTDYGKNPDLAKIDDEHYLNAYTGNSTLLEGWSTILIVELPAIVLDPPTDLFVDNSGYASWNAPDGDGMTQVDPFALDYGTGSTDGTIKTSTSMINAIGNVELGWAKFDISAIPAGSTIDTLRFFCYVNDTNWPYWSITPCADDPVIADAATLWANITANVNDPQCYSYNDEGSTFATGWHDYLLVNNAIADFEIALAQGWFAVGCADRDEGTSYYLNIDGWTEPNPLYIEAYAAGERFVIPAMKTDRKTAHVATDNTRELLGYNVYLNGGYADFTTDLFYQYTDLINGQTYFAGVTASYDEGESAPVEYEFTYEGAIFDPPTNVSVNPETGLLTWEDPEGAAVFTDDFDSYTAGEYLCTQTTDWATWGNTPGGTDDCYVVDVQANSGANSIEITGASDIIHPFGDLTTGAWGVSFMMYIEPTYGGYFNLLHEFTEWRRVRTEWALEAYFGSTGSGYLHAGGTNAATFTHPVGGWFEVETLIDLDADWAEFYVDGVFVHAWQWSLQSTGTPGLCQLGAIDIFSAAPTGDTPLFYIDDFAHTITTTERVLTGFNVYLDDMVTSIATVGADVFEYQYTDLNIGQEYIAGVSALYEDPTGESEIVEVPFTYNPIFNPPQNLAVECIEDYAHFTWEAPAANLNPGDRKTKANAEETRDLTGYNVYLDQVEVASNIPDLEYDFYSLVNGEYYDAGVKAIYDDGESELVEINFPYTGTGVGNILPLITELTGNYPNPFNPTTMIKFGLHEDQNVTLNVYNVKGEKVRTLVQGELEAGYHDVLWNGKDNSAKTVSSGVYFYKMKAGKYTSVKRMILMK